VYKYVCITTNQPDTKSNPNPNPYPATKVTTESGTKSNANRTTKQHAVVSIQLNIVARFAYPDTFIMLIIIVIIIILHNL